MLPEPSNLELGGLAILGTLGSVCAVLLRTTKHNLDSLEQMRKEASGVISQLRDELQENDQTISKLSALCADYRYQIGALKAERKQLKLEIQKLERFACEQLSRAAHPTNQTKKEEQ
jgi:septal ring factor EnvC (AmiA/AmiB activator)